jgi:addiction module HigA family antidote
MPFPSSQHTDSPGQVLRNHYLKPKGISIKEFSAMSGVHKDTLKDILAGERMAQSSISRISAVTRTSPRYWYYLQTMWLFRKYLEYRKSVKEIEAISLPWRTGSFESPGQILSRDFIKPSGENYASIERKYMIHYPPLCDVVLGKKAINPLLAAQLQAAFGASSRYWLDLQTCDDIRKIIGADLAGYKPIRASIEKFRNDLEQRKFRLNDKRKLSVHPGRILLKQFIKPSRMTVTEWHKILFIQIRELKLILTGKKRLSAGMIIKLCRAFKTDASYWIDLNNIYYSQLADAQYRRAVSRKAKCGRESSPYKYQPLPLFKFLEDNFLRPMDLPRKQFLRHIGIRRGYGDDLNVMIPRINFELAIRVGQALRLDPLYLVFIQMEHHIFLCENGASRSNSYP